MYFIVVTIHQLDLPVGGELTLSYDLFGLSEYLFSAALPLNENR